MHIKRDPPACAREEQATSTSKETYRHQKRPIETHPTRPTSMRERRGRHIDISVKTYNKSVGSTFVHHTMHPLAAVLWPLQQHLIFLQKTPCTQGEKDPVWGCECERGVGV